MEQENNNNHGVSFTEILLSKEQADPEVIDNLRNTEKNLNSPINLTITLMREICLPELVWNYFRSVPKKMKLTNSGCTAILSAKWFRKRPFLNGGPLIGNYVFSQMHFHWGWCDLEGSEHTVDGTQHPVEVHVIFFKSTYLTQEEALKQKDGVTILVYFFKLQSGLNPQLQILLNLFPNIREPCTSAKVKVEPLCKFLQCFSSDYFIYWGNIQTEVSKHLILWVICRQSMGIAADQVNMFRTLLGGNNKTLKRNFRNLESNINKHVYHINPSKIKHSTLLPFQDQKTLERFQRACMRKERRRI